MYSFQVKPLENRDASRGILSCAISWVPSGECSLRRPLYTQTAPPAPRHPPPPPSPPPRRGGAGGAPRAAAPRCGRNHGMRPAVRRWLIVAALLLVTFGISTPLAAYGVFLPVLADAFGWSRGAIASALD